MVIPRGKRSRVIFIPDRLRRQILTYCKKQEIQSGTVFVNWKGTPLDRSNVHKYLKRLSQNAGVDPETGEAMWYKGQEGDEKTKNVNEAGQRIVGSADPKFYGGFGMNFKYKGFDFSFDTSFTLGNKVYNSGFAFDMQVGHYFLGPVSNYVYDNRWQKPGDITDVPKFVAGDNSGAETNSSRFLMNGSYLRMKSMVLGYTLPKNLMNKVAIDNLRVYISADNLFTITAKDFIGFDPQTRSTGMQSWAYPVPRNIMFGLNLSF